MVSATKREKSRSFRYRSPHSGPHRVNAQDGNGTEKLAAPCDYYVDDTFICPVGKLYLII